MFNHIRAFLGLRRAQILFGQDKQEKVERGIAILKKILDSAPHYHYACFHLGHKLTEIGRFEEGISYLKRAVEQNPHNPVYYTFLGMALCDQKAYGEACEVLSEALKLDANNRLTYNCLALCHLGKGDFASFVKILENKGTFESPDMQSRLLLALESYHGKIASQVKKDALESSGSGK